MGKSNEDRLPGLPRGRHGLSRSFVVQNQRERILIAVAECVGAAGYEATTVDRIVQWAHVSRRTFYDHFSTKEDALLAMYDDLAERLYAALVRAVRGAPDPQARVVAGLAAFLEFAASEPTFEVCVVEAPAVGWKVHERRERVMQDVSRLFAEYAVIPPGDPGRVTPLDAEVIVGGIHEVVYQRVAHGQAADLPGLLPDLVFFCLLPYIGRQRASQARRDVQDGGGGHAAD